jgi:hypothetical protein
MPSRTSIDYALLDMHATGTAMGRDVAWPFRLVIAPIRFRGVAFVELPTRTCLGLSSVHISIPTAAPRGRGDNKEKRGSRDRVGDLVGLLEQG